MDAENIDIDADTGRTIPRKMNPDVKPLTLGSYPLNPQLTTTITWVTVGFIAGLLFRSWVEGDFAPRKKSEKNS